MAGNNLIKKDKGWLDGLSPSDCQLPEPLVKALLKIVTKDSPPHRTEAEMRYDSGRRDLVIAMLQHSGQFPSTNNS